MPSASEAPHGPPPQHASTSSSHKDDRSKEPVRGLRKGDEEVGGRGAHRNPSPHLSPAPQKQTPLSSTVYSDADGTDDGDSSGLSEVESSSDDDEAYSDGSSGASESAGSGVEEEESSSALKPKYFSRRAADNTKQYWTPSMDTALETAIALVPNLGKRSVKLGSRRSGRNGLLGEYVRRQTGARLNKKQVGSRLKTFVKHAGADSKRVSAVHGADVEDWSTLTGRDWSAFLRPDHHPPAKPAKKRTKKRATAKSAQPHKRRARSPPEVCFASTAFQPTQLPCTAPASSAATGSTTFTSSRSLTTPLAPSDLAALLTSSAPSHDFSSSAAALFSAGITTLDDFTNLIRAEQTTYESAVEMMVEEGRMEEEEGRWIIFAMGEARREMECLQ